MPVSFLPTKHPNNRRLPLYMTSIGYHYTERIVDRPQGYDDFQWLHTASGHGELLLDGKTYPLPPGTGIFLYPDVPHVYYPTSDQWETEWLAFNGKGAAAIVSDFGLQSSGIFTLKESHTLMEAIRKGYRLSLSAGEFQGLDLAGFLFDFLVRIGKDTIPQDRTAVTGHYDRLSPVLDYLDDHYKEPCELDTLATMIQVSPQYLCTLFKNVTGTRPAVYINQLRLNKAKELMLIHPELTIGAIAGKVGYDSPSYFSSVFKKYESITPGQFIARHRA